MISFIYLLATKKLQLYRLERVNLLINIEFSLKSNSFSHILLYYYYIIVKPLIFHFNTN